MPKEVKQLSTAKQLKALGVSGDGWQAHMQMVTMVSGRADRASAAETETRVRFPIGTNQRLNKLVFTASLLDVQQLKGQCEASTVCCRQMSRWDSRPKGPLAVSRPKQLGE